MINYHLCSPLSLKHEMLLHMSGGLILTLSAQSGLMRWLLLALKTSHDGG